jgi:hypothetical protein
LTPLADTDAHATLARSPPQYRQGPCVPRTVQVLAGAGGRAFLHGLSVRRAERVTSESCPWCEAIKRDRSNPLTRSSNGPRSRRKGQGNDGQGNEKSRCRLPSTGPDSLVPDSLAQHFPAAHSLPSMDGRRNGLAHRRRAAEESLRVPASLREFPFPAGGRGTSTSLRPWLTRTHTQGWRAHRRRTGSGHVYQGRFKSFPVQADEHFSTVCRYVERNALRANLAPVRGN